MPRKRRAAKLRRDLGLRLDGLELVDWLLTGRLREPEEVHRLRAEGIAYKWFLEFETDWPPANLATIWRTNRAALMGEAARRGIAQPWGLQFDDKETRI